MFAMRPLVVFQTRSAGPKVWGVGREAGRCDAFSWSSGVVQVGYCFGVVESDTAGDDSYLIVWYFACQAGQGEGGLLSVLVAFDGVDPHFLVGQAQYAEE